MTKTQMTKNKLPRTIPVLLLAIPLTGCATEDNMRLTLGEDDLALASILPPVPDEREGLIGSTDHDNIPGDEASTTGLDRSNFEHSVFLVPIDQTYHHPDYSQHLTLVDNLARQRGEFPTPETVLEQDGASGLDDLTDMVVAPLWAAVEFVWIAPSLIFDPPWETTNSPRKITGRTSDEPVMLVPGVVTLNEAEILDLENAPMENDSESDENPIDPSREAMPDLDDERNREQVDD